MKNANQKHQLTEGTSSVVMDPQGTAIDDCSPPFSNAIITYQISRFEIENGMTERIVHDLRVEPDNPLIRCGMDRVIFSVEGYDDDPRELFMIPEFRNYIVKVQKDQPAWIYFAALDSHWLKMIALCLVNNATAVTDKQMQRSKLSFSGKDLFEFIDGQVDPFFNLCAMAGVSPENARKRFQAVCESFGMPSPQL